MSDNSEDHTITLFEKSVTKIEIRSPGDTGVHAGGYGVDVWAECSCGEELGGEPEARQHLREVQDEGDDDA